jgi:hypothetical protein
MRRAWWWTAVAVLVACSESNGPGGVPEAQLNIVRQDALAPPLLAARDSFWAKVADGRELKLFYQGAQPGDTGEEFLRIEVPGDGLYRKPDGSMFQANDSILITVTAVDPSRFLFDFQPAGLQFSPVHPARLRVRYLQGEKDFDGDGDEDSADDEIEARLDLWYRSAPGALWFKLGGVKFEELDEIDANILTFSQYAVAW